MNKKQRAEVNEQVKFKLDQLMTGLKNTAKWKWHIAFDNMSQEQTHYWEAFTQLEQMMKKEIAMNPPWACGDKDIFERRRNTAVDELTNLFKIHGTRDYDHKIRSIVHIVEKALEE
jgi:hypothetical protein